jgi:hypothetical protein
VICLLLSLVLLEIKLLFIQADREFYLLTDAERTTATYSNRFAAHLLRQHVFRALATGRGWEAPYLGNWDNAGQAPTRRLPAHNLRIEFWVDPAQVADDAGNLTGGGVAYLTTDQVRFYRLTPESRDPLPLDQIPPLVFSEAMRDVDLFVAVCSVGADPTWADADSSARGAALHAAAGRGDREMVELLLQHRADPNGFVNASGNAVYAAKTPEIRKLLEAHGGFLDPYDLVWKGEDDEVMRIVTERPETALAGCGGVFTAVVTCGRRKLMHRLLDAGFKVHPQAGGCHSYLLERPDMLRELLTRGGLDPNYPTADGVTLLHELCHKDIRGRTMDHRT